jgi:succinoglycan biosynthesis transport protein ExoP
MGPAEKKGEHMAEREALDLHAYFDLVRRHKRVVLGCFLAAGIVSAVISFFFLPTVYRGSVTLMTKAVNNNGQRVLPETIQAYVKLLQKDEVVSKVIEQAHEKGMATDLSPQELRQMGHFREIQKVNLFELHIDSGDPRLAALLANIWADLFVKEVGNLARTIAQEASRTVEEDIKSAQAKLTEAQKELNEFCAKHYVREPEAIFLVQPIRTLTLERQRIESLADEIEQYGRKERALGILAQEVNLFVTENKAYAQSSETASLDDTLSLASFHAQYTSILGQAGQPVSLETPIQFAGLTKSAVLAACERTAARLVATIKILETERNKLKGELEQLKGELPATEAKLQELSQAVNDAMTELTQANARLSSVKQALAVATTEPVVILSRAYEPSSPVAPKRLVNIVVASALGLVVGLGMAFLSEYAYRSANRPATG